MSEVIVKPGLSAKEIAILHYQLLMDDNREEWIKTVSKTRRGISANNWWKTGRKYVQKKGWSYKFRHEDNRFKKDDYHKFFFYRLNEKGEEQGVGPVPIIIIKDPDDNDEWRVKVSSW